MEYLEAISKRRSFLKPIFLGSLIVIELFMLETLFGQSHFSSQIHIFLYFIGFLLIIWSLYDLLRVDNRNAIIEAFEELQKKELIDPKREIKSAHFVPNFKSGIFLSNTIFYSKKYEEQYCQLSKPELQFILLHEEGHKRIQQNSGIALAYTMGIVLSSYLLIHCGLALSGLPAGSILLIENGIALILIFIMSAFLRIFGKPLETDEYESDYYAARNLKYKLDYEKPSEIVKNAMNSLIKIHEPEPEAKRSLLERIIDLFFGYHPSTVDRIERIAKYVDVKS